MLYTLYHAVIARKYICRLQFCTRLKEHQRAVSNFNSSKSALAEHVCETSHNIAWDDSRIIIPLTIVMVNGFVWKPGISMRALVP